MCKTKSQNEAGGNSLCLVSWPLLLSFTQSAVVGTWLFFLSPLRFSSVESAAAWTLTLCVRSHVLMCLEYWRMAVWRGAWQVNPGWFFLTLVKVICRPIASSAASHTEGECGSVLILPSVRWPRRVAAPQTCYSCIALRAGEADLTNLTVDFLVYSRSVGWVLFSQCGQRLVYMVVWETWSEPGLASRFLWTPRTLRGYPEITSFNVTDRCRACAPQCDWRDLGWGQSVGTANKNRSIICYLYMGKGNREFALLHLLPTSEYRGGGWKRNSWMYAKSGPSSSSRAAGTSRVLCLCSSVTISA